MQVVVSLLRAVNVGGRNPLKMDALRRVYESLGLERPQTLLQSGNVVFGTEERDFVLLGARIEDSIERSIGFRPAVILRSSSDLKKVIRENPFASRGDIHPSRLLVLFLAGPPGREARDMAVRLEAAPEELRIGSRELYIYYPNGMGRPTVPVAALEKTLRTQGTGRNWNTVTRLAAMAEDLERALK